MLMKKQRGDLEDWYSADIAVAYELRSSVQIKNCRSGDPLDG